MKEFDPLRTDIDGTRLVEASAGTGKTHAIVTVYLRLVLEEGLAVNQILVVTYTNAATAELRARIRARLVRSLETIDALASGRTSDEPEVTVESLHENGKLPSDARNRVLAALHGFDEAAVSTIHGFCQRVLRENAFEAGAVFDAELLTDQRPLLRDVVSDFWVQHLHDAPIDWIEHLSANHVKPSTMEHLATLGLTHPDLRIVDGDAPEPDIDAARKRFIEQHTKMRAVWTEESDAIRGCLATPGLKKTYYKEEERLPVLRQLEQETEATPGLLRRFPKFVRLTSGHLRTHTNKGKVTPEHRFFDICQEVYDADEELAAYNDWRTTQLKRELITRVSGEMRTRKRERQVQSYDDLLTDVARALEGTGGDVLASQVRQQFRAALIDEFQDTDATQYTIFRRLFAEGQTPLVYVGDPKQAIYAFRGADVFTYMRARRDAGDHVYSQRRNWRSDPSFLLAINALYAANDRPFVVEGIDYQPVEPAPGAADRIINPASSDDRPLQFLELAPRDDAKPHNRTAAREMAAEGVAAEITGLLSSGTRLLEADGQSRPLRPQDIAVLCRTNRELNEMRQTLQAVGLHTVAQAEATVFETDEADDLERIARALAEPSDAGALRAALATALLGVDAAGLAALDEDEQRWADWSEEFRELHGVWRDMGLLAAFHQLFSAHDVIATLLQQPGGERRVTDSLHLIELAHTEERASRRGPLGLLRWLSVMRKDPSARQTLVGEAAQIRLESDENAVRLVTIHKSKGLEYPITFCPYLWDAGSWPTNDQNHPQFHDDEGRPCIALDARDKDSPARAAARHERLAEKMRVLYVALTRARHRCYVPIGAVKDVNDSGLGFLVTNGAKSDDAVTPALHALADAPDSLIGVRPLRTDGPIIEPERDADPNEFAARVRQRHLGPALRATSFSGLVASSTRDDSYRDTDAAARGPIGSLTSSPSPLRLAKLPAGARSGQMLHDILEQTDFRAPRESLLRRSADMLTRYGMDTRHADDVAQALEDVFATPLADGLRLRDIENWARRSELEFVFPVATEPGALRLTSHALAQVFRRHGAKPDDRNVPSFPDLRGHLRGFIDLVFQHQGRWFVVDYKSNHLGDMAADYAPAALEEPMRHHHYDLQYRIYTLAFVRYLRTRLPSFEYDRHFGGVFYLFLRGMHPEHATGTGVYFDRPTAALLRDMDAAMRGTGVDHG